MQRNVKYRSHSIDQNYTSILSIYVYLRLVKKKLCVEKEHIDACIVLLLFRVLLSINITLVSGNTVGREAIRFHLLVSTREVRDCAAGNEMNEPHRECERNRRDN